MVILAISAVHLLFKCFIDFIENVIFSVVSLLVVRQLNFL